MLPLAAVSPGLSILRQALERGTTHSPRFSEMLIIIMVFEYAEKGAKADVVVIKVNKDL